MSLLQFFFVLDFFVFFSILFCLEDSLFSLLRFFFRFFFVSFFFSSLLNSCFKTKSLRNIANFVDFLIITLFLFLTRILCLSLMRLILSIS